MGVAGAGKTLIGSKLAQALGAAFVDGDDYHPAENVKKMAAGIPLTDADRAGWLRALADRIRLARDANEWLVVACSALKRAYRDVLRAGDPDAQLVLLSGTRALLAERLGARHGHYMPASLLDSQLATLEAPAEDEHAWTYDVRESPERIVESLVAKGGAQA
jgi:gluconokinase